MEVFVTFKFKLKEMSRSGIACNLKMALLRYLSMSVRSRIVSKEEGLFT